MGPFSELVTAFAVSALWGAILYFFWNRRATRVVPLEALFTEREWEFNKQKLEEALVRQAEQLYEYRSDESHRVFADYIRNALNLELLRLTDGKVPDVDYAYHRGRIDSLRAVLNSREVAIQNKELLRKSEGKDPGAQEAKRSYVRAPATNAGLSI